MVPSEKAVADKEIIIAQVGMSAQDKKWQAEMDARTLADAAAIRGDPKRLNQRREKLVDLQRKSKSKQLR